ncbi:2-hydroxychromene-2-carboxylate isomerase [Roseovarius sp. TE539]|uniref:2-hydroxychromene-2-carboxylate isomerase n=1 Tax=Roseovarius sp. TE539 TaxID=2249812 RepID=UPI000DDF592A|nr:2-hydroxychromene-2-carboxylate isomerase [Roseovarius sp. TE539]RBI72709.1 2-hydroxychromene-2-carboxylate isomerase [Roseovarius sp. TE539]
MTGIIDFYFDFGSPYAYFAASRAEQIAASHGRALIWRPVLLWVCRNHFGMVAPLQDGPKADYMPLDFKRSAAFHGLPFVWPPSFGKSTHAAARLFYAMAERDADIATDFARRALDAHFGRGADLRELGTLADIAAEAGLPRQHATDLGTTDSAKAKLQQVNDEAIAAGVWGSPFFVVDGERFFGADRLPQLDWRLAQGRGAEREAQ